MLIGSHVSFGKDQLLGATKEALSYGANTFMFYTGAPTNTIRKDIEKKYIDEAQNLMKENNIDINKVVCHAPYIVNLANRSNEEKYNFSIDFIYRELKRCDEMGIKQMVLHPGNAVGISKEEALKNIIDAINIILSKDSKCRLLIETMAGKGSECGCSIEEITTLLDGINNKEQIGICLDTCHLSDAGYDMSDFDGYIEKLTQNIDIDYIRCIHVNDSKNPIGAHKDRHANLGVGYIGFATLSKIVNDKRFEKIPKILETPYIGNSDEDKERLYPPYKFEIEMLKNNKFDPEFKNKIREYYKS